MTELTTQKYFAPTDDGVRFLDPILGVPLAPVTPPPCLAHDPFTKPGITQLQKMAEEKRLIIQMVYSAHNTAQHFADVLSQFGKILSAAVMVGMETEWSPPTEEQRNSGLLIPEPIPPFYQEFRIPEIEWLTENGKTILPCEALYDGSTKLGSALNEIMDTWAIAKRNGDKTVHQILYMGFQTVREWIFYAHLGYWLWQLDSKGKLPAGQVIVPFTLGYGHFGTERKLTDYFGIPVEVYVTQHQGIDYSAPNKVARQEAFAAATSMAGMTNEQIATLVAHTTKGNS